MSVESPDLIDIFLQPGDYFVGDASFRCRTLLGSCVSITLWHPRKRIGAMSHFLLPGRVHGDQPDARYGDDALMLMMAELRGQGVRPSECEAKIFGGGNMFPGRRLKSANGILHGGPVGGPVGGPNCRANIGEKNGAAARALLAAHAIPVVSESLFGVGHRQILFDIANGDVWSRQVEKAAE